MGAALRRHKPPRSSRATPASAAGARVARYPSASLRREALGLDLERCRRRVLEEDLHRLARIFGQVLVDQVELAQELVRHRDDVAAAFLSVENVQQLAGARAQQL